MERLAATSRIAAHRSAIKLDFSISHDRNSVLILCIIVVAVFFGQGSSCGNSNGRLQEPGKLTFMLAVVSAVASST